jgi:hypothetical protein
MLNEHVLGLEHSLGDATRAYTRLGPLVEAVHAIGVGGANHPSGAARRDRGAHRPG